MANYNVLPKSIRKQRVTNSSNVIGIIPNDGKNINTLIADAFKSDAARVNYTIYATDITADAAGTQADATQLSNIGLQIVTTVAGANDAVKLTKVYDKLTIKVVNKGANILTVFPTTGESVDGVLNAGTNIAAGDSATFLGISSTEWLTI